MQTYLLNIAPQLAQLSEKLDYSSMLTKEHWVVIDDMSAEKFSYIFRSNGELLLSRLGKVQKAKWEYLGNKTLLIDKGDESLLFKHGFLGENVLALNVDGSNEYALLVTEEGYNNGLKSSDAIRKYLENMYSYEQSQPLAISGGLSFKYKVKDNKLNEGESFRYYFLYPLLGFILLSMVIGFFYSY